MLGTVLIDVSNPWEEATVFVPESPEGPAANEAANAAAPPAPLVAGCEFWRGGGTGELLAAGDGLLVAGDEELAAFLAATLNHNEGKRKKPLKRNDAGDVLSPRWWLLFPKRIEHAIPQLILDQFGWIG